MGGGSITRRSRSPKPHARAASGCWRIVKEYTQLLDDLVSPLVHSLDFRQIEGEERKENETERLTMEMHQTPRTAHPFYSLNHFLGRCTDLDSTHLGLTSSQSLLRHCACEYRSVAIQDVNPATWAAPRVLCAARYADGTVLQPVLAEHWCTVYSDSAADEKGGRGSACLAHPYDHDQTYHQDVHPDFG